MVIKDKVCAWFMRNILLPRVEIIDNPGFVICKFAPHKRVTLRDIFIGESSLQNLENSMKSYQKILYGIGKKFGHIYASISTLPQISETSKKEFLKFANWMVRYIETLYASKLSHKADCDNKIFEIKMYDYIICRKNGLGYLFSTGGIAGIWAYVVEDKTVEAVQPKCQGRGDEECKVIAAPYKTLVKMGYKPMRCTKLETLELDKEYGQFNQIRPTKWAKQSLKDLIDSGFFKYRHGQVTYQKERFFLCEASFMYVLEKEFYLF